MDFDIFVDIFLYVKFGIIVLLFVVGWGYFDIVIILLRKGVSFYNKYFVFGFILNVVLFGGEDIVFDVCW